MISSFIEINSCIFYTVHSLLVYRNHQKIKNLFHLVYFVPDEIFKVNHEYFFPQYEPVKNYVPPTFYLVESKPLKVLLINLLVSVLVLQGVHYVVPELDLSSGVDPVHEVLVGAQHGAEGVTNQKDSTATEVNKIFQPFKQKLFFKFNEYLEYLDLWEYIMAYVR